VIRAKYTPDGTYGKQDAMYVVVREFTSHKGQCVAVINLPGHDWPMKVPVTDLEIED